MTATRSSTSRRLWPWLLAVAGVLLVAFLAAGPNQQNTPYDFTSAGPDGTKALVQLLQKSGAHVDVTNVQPPPDADVAIAFPNALPRDPTDEMRAWVAAGHTLVVADPDNDLNPPNASPNQTNHGLSSTIIDQGDCSVDALRDARRLSVNDDFAGAATGELFPIPFGATACFTVPAGQGGLSGGGDEPTAVVVVVPMGKGQIVSMGMPAALTNAHLGEDDNAVLAVDLLAPREGTRVAMLQLPAGEVGEVSLSSLISIGVKLAILQLALALIVYLFFRGRRLGKPIVEPQLVQIPGSELVSAVGNLLQQTRSPDRAAAVLRGDLRRRLGDRLGLPIGTSPEIMAASVEARVGIPQEDVYAVLADHSCPSEADLLALAARIDELRRQVLGGR